MQEKASAPADDQAIEESWVILPGRDVTPLPSPDLPWTPVWDEGEPRLPVQGVDIPVNPVSPDRPRSWHSN